MTKKRLSDLLRDEAGKTPEPNEDVLASEVEIEVTAQEVLEEPAAGSTDEVLPQTEPDGSASRVRSASSPTKADLQATIAALQTDLHTAQQQEQQLQQQIAALQADLQQQQTLVQQLQAEVKQVDQIKTELEQAKQVILQLSAANAKPIESAPATGDRPHGANKSLGSQQPSVQPPAAHPKATAQPMRSSSSSKIVAAQPPDRRPLQLSPLPKMSVDVEPAVPRMSSESDTRLSDADIGWVD